MNPNTIGEVDLQANLALQIDENGDGTLDRTVNPASVLREKSESPTDKKKNSPNLLLIGGAAGGGGLFLLVMLSLGISWRSRRRQGRQPRYAAGPPVNFSGGAAILTIIQGPQQGRVVSLVGDRDIVIGRAPECELQLLDRAVSRHHARIRFYQGAWLLEDMGSSGGTYINARRIQTEYLSLGDQIVVGATTLVFDAPR